MSRRLDDSSAARSRGTLLADDAAMLSHRRRLSDVRRARRGQATVEILVVLACFVLAAIAGFRQLTQQVDRASTRVGDAVVAMQPMAPGATQRSLAAEPADPPAEERAIAQTPPLAAADAQPLSEGPTARAATALTLQPGLLPPPAASIAVAAPLAATAGAACLAAGAVGAGLGLTAAGVGALPGAGVGCVVGVLGVYTVATFGPPLVELGAGLVDGIYRFFADSDEASPVASGPPYPNTGGDTALERELQLARELGVEPVQPGDSAFDDTIESGRVKWAVDESGNLLFVPASAQGQEISHTVLTGGEPVLAAGEADIVPDGEGGYLVLEVTRQSGHFQPTVESLDTGVSAFRANGLTVPEDSIHPEIDR